MVVSSPSRNSEEESTSKDNKSSSRHKERGRYGDYRRERRDKEDRSHRWNHDSVEDRSGSPRQRRKSRSGSPKQRRRSGSGSPRQRRKSRSGSPRQRRRSRSGSPRRRKSRSPSPRRRRRSVSGSPKNKRQRVDKPADNDKDVGGKTGGEDDPQAWFAAKKKKAVEDPINTRAGGAYIPPAKLKMMQQQIADKNSESYQRLAWEHLKKKIHGHVNRVNISNMITVVQELLQENIIRGKGLLARSIIQAQAFSPTYSNVYAGLVAVINSKFPHIGELILRRLIISFKRSFKRNDKQTCINVTKFMAHLINQQVAHELLALELLTLLLETPTEDSVEVAIAFLKEIGAKLTDVSPRGINAIFDRLRSILHDEQLDKRVTYMIEVIFHVRKDKFSTHPAVIDELDLIEDEDQITHTVLLDDAQDPENILNVFRVNPEFEKDDEMYNEIKKEVLGSGDTDDEESEEEEEETTQQENKTTTVIDNTETALVAFRRNVYLTIQSSLDFEEAVHKLLQLELKPGMDVELCHMIIDCCAQQRTYEKFYGLLAERFCRLKKDYQEHFEEIFRGTYDTIHRFDITKLRNVTKQLGHLLFTNAIDWGVLRHIKLNEDDTTSSSRIFIKVLFQELAEYLGLDKLYLRIRDPTMQAAFDGIFPRDNPRDTRFSINFFTSIGLGGLTVDLREFLKSGPKQVVALPSETQAVVKAEPDVDNTKDSDSDSDSSSSSSSSSDSSSSSEDENKKKKKKSKKAVKSPPPMKIKEEPPSVRMEVRKETRARKSPEVRERGNKERQRPERKSRSKSTDRNKPPRSPRRSRSPERRGQRSSKRSPRRRRS